MTNREPLSKEEAELASILVPQTSVAPKKDLDVFRSEIQMKRQSSKMQTPWRIAAGVPVAGVACALVFLLLPNTAEQQSSSQAMVSVPETQTIAGDNLAERSWSAFNEEVSALPDQQDELIALHDVISTWEWDTDNEAATDDESVDMTKPQPHDADSFTFNAMDSGFDDEDGTFDLDNWNDETLLAFNETLTARLN